MTTDTSSPDRITNIERDYQSFRGLQKGQKSLPKNAAFRIVGGFVLPLIFTLMLTPLFLESLGDEGYGLWAICMSILGFSGLLDWGIATAGARYIAEHLGTGNTQKVAENATAVVLFHLFCGLLGALLLFLFAREIAGLFKVPQEMADTALLAVHVTAVGVIPIFLRNGFAAIPIGFERFDLSTGVFLSNTILSLGGMTIMLHMGSDLIAVLRWIVFSGALVAVMAGVISFILINSLGKLELRVSGGTVRELLKFAAFTGTSSFGSKLFNSLDRLLVGGILGAAFVTYYVIPIAVANKILSLTQNTAQVLMPRASYLVAKGNRSELKRLVEDSYLVVSYSVFWIGCIGIILSKPVLVLWLGVTFAEHALLVFRVLIIIYVILALCAPALHFANGLGIPWINTLCILAGSGISLTGMILLGHRGVPYFAVSNIGGLTVIVVLIVLTGKVGLAPLTFVARYLGPPLLTSITLAGGFLIWEEALNPWLYGFLSATLFAIIAIWDCRNVLGKIWRGLRTLGFWGFDETTISPG